MAWRKLGLVFVPTGNHPWMLSHASNPTPEWRSGEVVRVYFSSRDARERAHIAWVDLEMTPSPRVIHIADEPVVSPGPRGGFDDSGTSMGCLAQHGEQTFLYYLGWNLGVTVPWRNSIGLAIRQRPDGLFEKYSPAPLLDRNSADPFTLSYPCVLAATAQSGGCGTVRTFGWGSHEKRYMDPRHQICGIARRSVVATDRRGLTGSPGPRRIRPVPPLGRKARSGVSHVVLPSRRPVSPGCCRVG